MTRLSSPNGGYASPAADFACPACYGRLSGQGGALACPVCQRAFPVRDGVPHFLLPETLDQPTREAQSAWNDLAPVYPAFVDELGPARFAPIDRPLLAIASGDVLEVGCGD